MALSVTAVPQPGNIPPRVLLTVAGGTGPTATVTRIDAAGNTNPVRLANPFTLVSGAQVGYDYECPFGQPVTYQASDAAVPLPTTAPVTLAVAAPWLLHPGIPSLSQPINVADLGDDTYPSTRGVHAVLGRDTSIVVTSGVRKAAEFSLTLRTVTDTDRDALSALLADDSSLLLQVAYPGLTGLTYRWVSIGDAVAARIDPYFGESQRVWTLPCTVTDAPSGLLQSQRTWAALLAAEATWAAVLADYATWYDVIIDNRRGGSASPVYVPPAADSYDGGYI